MNKKIKKGMHFESDEINKSLACIELSNFLTSKEGKKTRLRLEDGWCKKYIKKNGDFATQTPP